MNITLKIFLILLIAIFSQVELKKYTVCELAEELYYNHSIPRENVYKHLCIVGDFLHTNYSSYGFHGIYRIGEQWWCGNDQPGGNCNVKCDDLKDDDIRDDIMCAEKVLESHGTQGWTKSEVFCNKTYSPKVDACLETIEQFELRIEAENTTITPKTTKKYQPENLKTIQHDENSNSSLNLNFIFGLLLIAALSVIIVLYIKYQKMRNFLMNSINNSVQMTVENRDSV
ncbi:hypothetical protein PVAND_008790 [Polypedilum vanderplanki]|uniref:lysozyme n=1 Tax=Polypedilum vanderplanki TaxID=319348 RepID=A0A9J6CBU8_POLVA|nr:hypothetical protein PVAND_008790 [Polypedilum vanderplanki]